MADFANKNNADNVSTTRGVAGGYFLSAAKGVEDIPTKDNISTWKPSDAWENQGYVPEDGFTEGVEKGDETQLRDINLDVVDSSSGGATETLTIGLMEQNARSLSTQYGHENVTDEDGVIVVEHDWSKADETRAYVLLLLLKNGRKWIKFIPEGKVTALSEFTGNATTAAQRQVTITYLKGDAHPGCIDIMESNDTEVVPSA